MQDLQIKGSYWYKIRTGFRLWCIVTSEIDTPVSIYLDALTRHLAVKWGPQNIRINCVSPGPIEGTVGFNKLGTKQFHFNIQTSTHCA